MHDHLELYIPGELKFYHYEVTLFNSINTFTIWYILSDSNIATLTFTFYPFKYDNFQYFHYLISYGLIISLF